MYRDRIPVLSRGDFKMFSLGSTLSEMLKGLGLYKKYQQHQVWEVWDRAVGPRISAVAQPERINFDTLFVSVSDSMWLHQLNSLQQEFLDKLNGALGSKAIGRIYFRLGNPRHGRSFKQEGFPNVSSFPEPEPEELEAINETLKDLKDEESRDVLKSIMIKSAALAKKMGTSESGRKS